MSLIIYLYNKPYLSAQLKFTMPAAKLSLHFQVFIASILDLPSLNSNKLLSTTRSIEASQAPISALLSSLIRRLSLLRSLRVNLSFFCHTIHSIMCKHSVLPFPLDSPLLRPWGTTASSSLCPATRLMSPKAFSLVAHRHYNAA